MEAARTRRDTGIVNEDINTTLQPLDLAKQALDRLNLGHVAENGLRRTASLANETHRLLSPCEVAISADHICAKISQAPREGPAQPISRPRDHRHAAIHLKNIGKTHGILPAGGP